MKQWLTLADFNQMLSEIAQAPTIAVDTFPIEPADIVVLPVGVIVAFLGAGELVAREVIGVPRDRRRVASMFLI